MERKLYFDLSILASTAAGSAIHAWELCHRLMRLAKPLQVIPFSSPFKTQDKTGLNRAFNAVLRDTLWQNWLAGMEANQKDYFIFPNLNVPRKFYPLEYAVFVHDLGSWHNRSYLKWRGSLTTQAIPKALKNANCIFAVSEYTAQDVAREFGIAREQITVAPNGLSSMYACAGDKIQTINGVTLPAQYFLHVGTFEPKKNLFFLLQVYERFRELTGKAVKLLLTGGEFWHSSQFFRRVHESQYSNEIIILGRVETDKLPSLYRGATALVFPSTFEGFGIPAIEALSQGTPVLVNSNTSLTQFGEFGATVFDNFDAEIWARELDKILAGKKLASEYPAQVRNYFDWDRTAKIVWERLTQQIT